MKKITKSSNTSTDPDELPKMSTLMQLVDPRSNLLLNPDNEDWRRRLCYTILKYASRKETTTIKEFCYEYGISYDLLKGWIDKYDDVRSAYKNAKLWIGLRRQKKAEAKELDGQLVSRTLHTYDDEWKDINAYHSALKQLEAERANIIYIDGRKPITHSQEELQLEVDKTQE